MPHLVYCKDRPDAGDLRQQTLSDHLAYIETVMDKVAVAGPMRTAAGTSIVGSCFIYHTEDRSEATRLLENDPYHKCGLYGQVEMLSFTVAAGTWIGGKTW